MVFLRGIHQSIPIDLVPGQAERLHVEDVHVALVRANVQPLVLQLQADIRHPLLGHLQALHTFWRLFLEIPQGYGVVRGRHQDPTRVDHEDHLEDGALLLMLELHVDPGAAVQPDHARPVANGHDLLQGVKGQGCRFVWKAMFQSELGRKLFGYQGFNDVLFKLGRT